MLYREINENVNFLVSKLEENDSTGSSKGRKSIGTNSQDYLYENKNLKNLKQNLNLFKFKINDYKNLIQIPNSTTKFKYQENSDQINNKKSKVKKYLKRMKKGEIDKSECDSYTTSNTLVDADSSFDSAKFEAIRSQFQFLDNQVPMSNDFRAHLKSSKMNGKKIDEYNAYLLDNDSEEDEDEKIEVNMGDLSITTIQTSNINSMDETNDSVLSIRSDDNIEFQDDLKKLDQRIFKVKQMLNSIKSK